jgi:hypothetical protein
MKSDLDRDQVDTPELCSNMKMVANTNPTKPLQNPRKTMQILQNGENRLKTDNRPASKRNQSKTPQNAHSRRKSAKTA